MRFEAFADFELPDVKLFRLRLRAEAGVHFFAIAGGEQSFFAVGKLDELIIVRHWN